MKNVVKLSERDLRKIVSKVLNEQPKKEMDPYISTPGRGDYLNRTAGSEGEMLGVEKILQGKKLDGSMFLNGVDKIDKNSSAYKAGLSDLKKLYSILKSKSISGFDVTVQGGASAVGSSGGYDNDGLAKRRANNFIRAVREDLPADLPIRFSVTSTVGKATKQNSPEANAEQFVKLSYPDKTAIKRAPVQLGRDNTAGRYSDPNFQPKNKPVGGDRPYMILKVYYNEGTKQGVLNKLYGATRDERTVTTDITDKAKKLGL